MVDESETLGGALEDLQAFCAVIEFGSISAAARQLAETKGGISRRISRLEARLGAALLARTPRAVSATEEGTAFYLKARDALSLLSEAANDARQSGSVPRGHLRITAPMDMGMEILPPVLVRFRAMHPQISVELLLTDSTLDLAANRIDLALRATPGNLPSMNYRASTLSAFALRLYAAPSYLVADGTPQNPPQLPLHSLVGCRELSATNSLQLTDSRGRNSELLVNPSVRTSDYASTHRLLLAGAGIGALPDLVAAGSLASGLLQPVLPDWHINRGTLYAISLGGAEAPARVRVFRDYLRGELALLQQQITVQT
ncbi:MAG: LysR family transcriptional regulator [Halopseudomonas sp.]|uniref:LysR family transcriptional regulator n=1 Tax=Halopseudomonas sp. TaxID=2901191 RepID=UPI003001D930